MNGAVQSEVETTGIHSYFDLAHIEKSKGGKVMLKHVLSLGLFMALSAPATAMAQDMQSQRFEQARINYEAVKSGRKSINQLSQQELRDLMAFDELANPHDRRSHSQRCLDEERKRAGPSPSRLELRVIAMKCREPGERLK